MDIPEDQAKILNERWCAYESALDVVAAAKNDLETAKWAALKEMKLSPRRHTISFDARGVPRVVSAGE